MYHLFPSSLLSIDTLKNVTPSGFIAIFHVLTRTVDYYWIFHGTATADEDEDEEGGVRWPLQRVHRRFFFSNVSELVGKEIEVGVVGAVLAAIEGRGVVGDVGEDVVLVVPLLSEEDVP